MRQQEILNVVNTEGDDFLDEFIYIFYLKVCHLGLGGQVGFLLLTSDRKKDSETKLKRIMFSSIQTKVQNSRKRQLQSKLQYVISWTDSQRKFFSSKLTR